MKLFIAIELNGELRAEVAGVLRRLEAAGVKGRFASENRFFVVLHNLGETDDLGGAVEALCSAVRDIKPFVIWPAACGFQLRGDGTVPFVSVGGDSDELNILHEALESALADNGFSREYRKFVPKIFLGRSIELGDKGAEILNSAEFSSSQHVGEITLFELTRERGGIAYNPLHRQKI